MLTIGNSFSLNATRYLAPILNDYGVENATVGVLYRGSSSLQEHEFYAKNKAVGYHYYQADNAVGFVETKDVNFYHALEQEDWDIIVMQHGAGKQGSPDTYDADAITYLINTIKQYCPNAALYWHMDWSYAEGYTGVKVFVDEHGSSCEHSYRATTETVQQIILPDERFEAIIPTGTLIHLLRQKYTIKQLQTDQRHLSNPLGEFSAATVFACVLLERGIESLTYCPTSLQNTDLMQDLKTWVPQTLSDPFGKTVPAYVPEK